MHGHKGRPLALYAPNHAANSSCSSLEHNLNRRWRLLSDRNAGIHHALSVLPDIRKVLVMFRRWTECLKRKFHIVTAFDHIRNDLSERSIVSRRRHWLPGAQPEVLKNHPV